MLSSILNYLVNLFCGPSPPPPQEAQQQQQQLPLPQHQQPPPRPHKPSSYGYDSNQINQSNEYYLGLRSQATEEGDSMAKCFEQSHQAYSSGDKAGAKTLSNRGKEHQRKMEALNKEASDWIFTGTQSSSWTAE